jgi:hypothetical protein
MSHSVPECKHVAAFSIYSDFKRQMIDMQGSSSDIFWQDLSNRRIAFHRIVNSLFVEYVHNYTWRRIQFMKLLIKCEVTSSLIYLIIICIKERIKTYVIGNVMCLVASCRALDVSLVHRTSKCSFYRKLTPKRINVTAVQ